LLLLLRRQRPRRRRLRLLHRCGRRLLRRRVRLLLMQCQALHRAPAAAGVGTRGGEDCGAE
jgi:hypothetical protein